MLLLEWNLSLRMQSRDGDNLLDLPKLQLLEYKIQTLLELYLVLTILKMQFMEVIQVHHGNVKLIIFSLQMFVILHILPVALLASLNHMQLLMVMLVKLLISFWKKVLKSPLWKCSP